jgi:hypothetical protein
MAEEPIKLFATRAERYPESSDADIPQAAVRVALTVLGGPLPELLSLILTPALARRRDVWFKEFADAFDELSAKIEGVKVENLADNEAFVSATIQASRIAIGTHQAEKREMLRNALLNVAVGGGPQEDLQEIFIAAIESLSPTLMKVLRFLSSSLPDLQMAGISWTTENRNAFPNYSAVIGELYPELKSEEGLLTYTMLDLYNRGFSKVPGPLSSFPQQPAVADMGVEFLRFVLEPPK